MRAILILLSLTLVMFSCKNDKKLTVPKSDATSPTFKWLITDSSSASGVISREFTGENNEWDITPHNKISIQFTVEDADGGVKKVAISASGLTACSMSMQDDIAEVSLPSDTLILQPGKNNEVQATAVKSAVLDLACRKKEGEVFPQVARGPGGTIELQGYGENFHNGKVRSRLIIKTNPL